MCCLFDFKGQLITSPFPLDIVLSFFQIPRVKGFVCEPSINQCDVHVCDSFVGNFELRFCFFEVYSDCYWEKVRSAALRRSAKSLRWSYASEMTCSRSIARSAVIFSRVARNLALYSSRHDPCVSRSLQWRRHVAILSLLWRSVCL
jgi:hypothetical protein